MQLEKSLVPPGLKGFTPIHIVYRNENFCIAAGYDILEGKTFGICNEEDGKILMPFNAAGKPVWYTLPQEISVMLSVIFSILPEVGHINKRSCTHFLENFPDLRRAIGMHRIGRINAPTELH